MSKKKTLEKSDASIIIGIHCATGLNIILSIAANYWVVGVAYLFNTLTAVIAIIGEILILLTQPKWHKLLAIFLILLNIILGGWALFAFSLIGIYN